MQLSKYFFSSKYQFSKLIEFQNEERSVAFDTRFTGGGESLSQKLYRSAMEKYTQEQCQRGVNSPVTPTDLPRRGGKLSRDILPLFFLSYFNSLSSPLSNLLSQRQASSLEFRSFCISSDPLNPLLFERAREKDWNDIFKKVLQRCTPLMINRDF